MAMFICKNTNNVNINYFTKVFFKTILTLILNQKIIKNRLTNKISYNFIFTKMSFYLKSFIDST